MLLLTGILAACGGGGGGGGSPTPPVPGQIPAGPLSIGGAIAVSAFVAVDSDTNDAAAVPVSNNSPASAQALPNPGNVGGYVTEAGVGNFGPLLARGDLHDFYRVNLLAGQAVRLTISDHDAADALAQDLDLLLVDLDNVLMDFSAGFGPTEELVVGEAGEYVIVVTVCADVLFADPINICGAGASNYQLVVGQPAAPLAAPLLRLSDDFMPGEAVAEFRAEVVAGESDEAAPLRAAASTAAAPRAGMQLVRFATTVSPVAAAAPATGDREPLLFVNPEHAERIATLASIRGLVRSGEVEWAEPNYMRRLLFEPNDPGYQFQWHFPLINLPAAWDTTLGDPNVIVAVIDTGILASHPDINGQLIGGFDFVTDVANAGDGNGPDPDPEDPGDGGNFGFSSSFHGTHVAGTVAASTDNQLGVSGVAPGVRLMPLRALGQSGGSVFDVRRAMCYAAGVAGTEGCPANAAVPVNPNPVDVINLSLGGGSFSLAEQRAVDDIRAAGVTIVAAAGNDSSANFFYPAAYDGVVAVSAVTIQKQLAPYSSFGSFIDVAAPGGSLSTDINGDGYSDGVLSTGGDDSFVVPEFVYPFFQGTSMAAPHVAGVFALMKSVNAMLTPADFDRLLEQGALTDAANPGVWNAQFGYGLVNAQKAVSAALAEPGGGTAPAPNPWLGVTPRALNFGATLDTLTIDLRNNAGGTLTVDALSSDAAWLAAPPAAGLGDYEVVVDRTGLADGTYSGTLTVQSSVNTVQLPVIMQVSQVSTTGNAGPVRVRLLDEGTGLIREVTVAVNEGIYAWQIDGIPAGRYRLFAFSDADNDDLVCDPGEACGAYLTTDQPLLLDVDTTLQNLDFPISFGNEAIGTIPTP